MNAVTTIKRVQSMGGARSGSKDPLAESGVRRIVPTTEFGAPVWRTVYAHRDTTPPVQPQVRVHVRGGGLEVVQVLADLARHQWDLSPLGGFLSRAMPEADATSLALLLQGLGYHAEVGAFAAYGRPSSGRRYT